MHPSVDAGIKIERHVPCRNVSVEFDYAIAVDVDVAPPGIARFNL
jgi:hypothetical protein